MKKVLLFTGDFSEYQNIPVDQAYVDGNLVSSPALPGHPAFIREFIKLLGGRLEA